MADISKLNLTGTDLDIKDSTARAKLTVIDPTAGEGLITFGVDANGNYGYKKVGADTVTPFLSGGETVNVSFKRTIVPQKTGTQYSQSLGTTRYDRSTSGGSYWDISLSSSEPTLTKGKYLLVFLGSGFYDFRLDVYDWNDNTKFVTANYIYQASFLPVTSGGAGTAYLTFYTFEVVDSLRLGKLRFTNTTSSNKDPCIWCSSNASTMQLFLLQLT